MTDGRRGQRDRRSGVDGSTPSGALITTAHLSDVSPWGVVMDGRIRAVWEGARLCGRAYTVKVAPGDNASLMVALAEADSGDVIVCDGAGVVDRSLWGEIMARAAMQRGIVGLVCDGAVRDVAEMREMGFPAFAAAVTPLGPYSKVPGAVRIPIVVGGLPVAPGDAVYADDDGVVVIPADRYDGTLERVHDRIEREATIVAGLDDGRPLNDLLGVLAGTRRS